VTLSRLLCVSHTYGVSALLQPWYVEDNWNSFQAGWLIGIYYISKTIADYDCLLRSNLILVVTSTAIRAYIFYLYMAFHCTMLADLWWSSGQPIRGQMQSCRRLGVGGYMYYHRSMVCSSLPTCVSLADFSQVIIFCVSSGQRQPRRSNNDGRWAVCCGTF
jgi:hypothetical protein